MADKKLVTLIKRGDLQGANLHGADLQGANLLKANLLKANLLGADLLKANLQEANLLRANLHGADLQGANLLKANLLKANLLGADLRGADLQGANLLKANLLKANLLGAIVDSDTIIEVPHPYIIVDLTIQISDDHSTITTNSKPPPKIADIIELAEDLLVSTDQVISQEFEELGNHPPDDETLAEEGSRKFILLTFRKKLEGVIEAAKTGEDRPASTHSFIESTKSIIGLLKEAETTKTGLLVLAVGATSLIHVMGTDPLYATIFSFSAVFGPEFTKSVSGVIATITKALKGDEDNSN